MKLVSVNVNAAIVVPFVPSFLRTENGGLIPVEALTEDELRHLGRVWVANLLEHAASRRSVRTTPAVIQTTAPPGAVINPTTTYPPGKEA